MIDFLVHAAPYVVLLEFIFLWWQATNRCDKATKQTKEAMETADQWRATSERWEATAVRVLEKLERERAAK